MSLYTVIRVLLSPTSFRSDNCLKPFQFSRNPNINVKLVFRSFTFEFFFEKTITLLKLYLKTVLTFRRVIFYTFTFLLVNPTFMVLSPFVTHYPLLPTLRGLGPNSQFLLKGLLLWDPTWKFMFVFCVYTPFLPSLSLPFRFLLRTL